MNTKTALNRSLSKPQILFGNKILSTAFTVVKIDEISLFAILNGPVIKGMPTTSFDITNTPWTKTKSFSSVRTSKPRYIAKLKVFSGYSKQLSTPIWSPSTWLTSTLVVEVKLF